MLLGLPLSFLLLKGLPSGGTEGEMSALAGTYGAVLLLTGLSVR